MTMRFMWFSRQLFHINRFFMGADFFAVLLDFMGEKVYNK